MKAIVPIWLASNSMNLSVSLGSLRIDFRYDMGSLPYQAMLHFLSSKNQNETLFFYRIIPMVGTNHCSAKVVYCLSCPFSFVWASNAPKSWSITLTHNKNGLPDMGVVNSDGLVRYCLMSLKDFWHSTSHISDISFFISLEMVDISLLYWPWNGGCMSNAPEVPWCFL